MSKKTKFLQLNRATSWMKLDNAAKIYPAVMTSKWHVIFRLSATLCEDIDRDILKEALQRTLTRLPSFSQTLKRGFFWFYLEHKDGAPKIDDDSSNPCGYFDVKANGGFLIRIRCYRNRIAVEYSHVVCDGTGAASFLMTLCAEYISLKYSVDIPRDDTILDCNEKQIRREYEDSFLKHAKRISVSRKEEPAYHINGTKEEAGKINIITGRMKISDVKREAAKYGATVNDYLVSALICAIDDDKKERKIRSKKPIKICVPVNLRKFYGSRTLRNFSSYVNIGIEPKYGEYTFSEVIETVKHTIALEVTEKKLSAKMSTNVAAEKNVFVRLLPLFLKNPIMKLIYLANGDRYYSCTLSNLGLKKMPWQMQKYITDMDFILGVAENSINCACIGCKDSISVSFSRNIRESGVMRHFFTRLVKDGIGVKIESNCGR